MSPFTIAISACFRKASARVIGRGSSIMVSVRSAFIAVS
jgi:hypothetical protein